MEELNTKQKLRVLLPYGMVATKQWLLAQGLSTHAVDNAVKSGKLLLLTPGVYAQYSSRLRWEGVVASLQKIVEAPIYVGGESALALSGLAHYLPLSARQTVHFYSSKVLPRWLFRLSVEGDVDANFTSHSTKRLWPEAVMRNEQFVKCQEWQPDVPAIQFSCSEKAIIEVLTNVPKTVTFEHVDELMQGLVNLSPKKLDSLLSDCLNIKVKRLFFWLAERNNHQWFSKLNAENYELGAGKRVVAMDGRLDKTYMITVPQHM